MMSTDKTIPRHIFQMRVTHDLLDRIRQRARKERRSASEWLRHCAELELRRKPRA